MRPSTSSILLPCRPCPFLPAFSIRRSMYEEAGAGMVGLGDEGDERGGQKHTGGKHDKGGRPVGTRRFTRETLSIGCRKAMAISLSQYGDERFLAKVKIRTTCTLTEEDWSRRLSSMANVSCRGEVWPLLHVFGFFSKFEGGMASVDGERDVACTWVGRNGYINCSCQGRTRLLSIMRRPAAEAADVECTHGSAMAKTLRKLTRELGIDMRSVRAVVGNLHRRCRSRLPDAVEGDGGDDGDCQRFVIGQSVFGVAVTGHGDQVVAAPVRFTRKTTSCMLCDTARTASCTHVSLTRHFKRSVEGQEQSAAATQQKGATTEEGSAAAMEGAYSEEDVVQSVSQKPMGLFNCHKATLADKAIGDLVANGGTFHVLAPKSCPKCHAARGSAVDVGADGVILCTAGPCRMRIEAYLCTSDDCGEWVSADGANDGIVIYTPCTAASAALMRQWAFAMVLDGTTYASSFDSWCRSYFDRRDAGTAAACRMRGRQTINKVFNAAVRLMTDDPPIWSFSCTSCQDADGRFRVVTADGIWLGFLRRLATTLYANPCQPCKSVPESVQAGSLCGSEAVRRFIRLSLKQPSKAIVVKTGQLQSAEKALSFLCPSALPEDRVAASSEFEATKMSTLHNLLTRVWVLEKATYELARGIVKRIQHMLTNEISNSRRAQRVAADRATVAHIRQWLAGIAPAPAAAGGLGGAAGGGGGSGADGSDGESSNGPEVLPPRPPPAGRRGRRGGRGPRGRGARNLPVAALRAGREAAAARRRHERVTVAEPSDPRCLQQNIKDLGPDLFKPIVSFCVALATDAVVNAFKPRHMTAIAGVADDMAADDAAHRIDALLCAACDPAARTLPAAVGGVIPDAALTLAADKARVTYELRVLMAFLLALRFDEEVFESLHASVASVLRTVCDTVKDYHLRREGDDRSALEFGDDWLDPLLSPQQLEERFKSRFPHASDDPMVTGCFFPGLSQCRPCPFSPGEKPMLGMCAKHYQAARQFFSPGTFTVCCACSHPKLIGFVVLDKREGPYALLNAIITRFALLPHFVVYDFGCGALRSAVGKLPVFVALVVIISDLFHIVNHVCSDLFNPRSYTPLDGKNTVAHEQRNSPIAAIMKTLRACGQAEYMRIMKLHTILHNVQAQARGTCTYPLPEDYNFRQFYFSRHSCPCGCGQQEEEPPLASPPSSAASTPITSSSGSTSSSMDEHA